MASSVLPQSDNITALPSIASRSLGFRRYRCAKFFGDDTSFQYREIEEITAKNNEACGRYPRSHY